MQSFNFCRICLAHNGRMYVIPTAPLQEFYEKITDIQFNAQDGSHSVVCCICYHLLHKCRRFAVCARKTDEVLQQLLSNENELTEKAITALNKPFLYTTLVTTQTECIELLDQTQLCEDLEVPIVKDEEIKKEDLPVTEEAEDDKEETEPLQSEEPHHSSDSEDDVPLKSFSTKRTDRKIKKRATKKIGLIKKKEIKEVIKADAREIILSQEEQLEQMAARSKSHNYLHSPHQCRLRYKGLFDSTTADYTMCLDPTNFKVIKADAREIILSQEEQLEQMAARSKSHNYLHSPHQCRLCYKGFVDLKAFENHKEKHDERSGEFECHICHMRYKTARHLRTHTHTCHERQYACNKCAHRSHTANQAREHEKWHSGYTYECQLCSQKFRKPTSYLTHLRKRHPTSHACSLCGDSFVGAHGLRMHEAKAHQGGQQPKIEEGEQKFCAECNMHFVSLDAWKRHILSSVTHALGNDSRTTCLACGVLVPGASLRSHLREHERTERLRAGPPRKPIARLPCEQCGKNFINRSKLHAHIKRIHLGVKYNKNIVCEVCGKKCTSNASLKYHQRTHTGERPYNCAQCAKRFADKNQLRIHTRTHTGERPYSCSVCSKRFSQKPALNRHYRIHTGAKPYDCQFCAKTFSQSNSLKLHVNTVHLKLPHAKKKTSENAQDP